MLICIDFLSKFYCLYIELHWPNFFYTYDYIITNQTHANLLNKGKRFATFHGFVYRQHTIYDEQNMLTYPLYRKKDFCCICLHIEVYSHRAHRTYRCYIIIIAHHHWRRGAIKWLHPFPNGFHHVADPIFTI